jgi:signal transduction histidine kinase
MLAQAVEGKAHENALLETALGSAHRLQDSIEGLLRYASVGKTQSQTIAADEIVDQALADLSVELDAAAADVVREPLPRVEADPAQLRSVFQNLIANAIRYRSDEPLQVEVGSAGGALYVRDNGRGIDPVDHQRVFELFRRGGSAGDVDGVGIGLALARRIVEAHGGELWLESEPKRGTTFFFTVPVVA